MTHQSLFVRLLFAVVISCVSSCITPFQPDAESQPSALVVEGMITDQPGPYFVQLTRTADYSFKALNYLVNGATVTISDNLGNKEQLTEIGSTGVYSSSPQGMQGVPGRTYQVTIRTPDGNRYESDPELLKASPPIKNLYYKFREDPYGLSDESRSGWDVYIDMQDPDTPGDYYRWTWTHYSPIVACRSDPTGSITQPYQDYYCCTECWDVVRCYDCITISSDATINGNMISNQLVTRVPFSSRSRYYMEVEQQSLSRGAFQFWKTVRQMINNTGGLFDAAPASIPGNIRSLTNANEAVYGFFGAAGVTVQPLYVERTNGIGTPPLQRPLYFGTIPPPCVTCENNPYRTRIRPRWWQY